MRNLWFLFLLFPAVGLAQNENPILEAAKFCNETLKDKDLEVLRGKLPLYGENVTPEMLKNYSKPTPNEAKAIQLYLKKKIECNLLMKKAIGQIPGAPSNQTLLEQKSSELINPYQYDAVLAYLMTGFITYADFVRWSDAESRRLNKLVESEREGKNPAKQFSEQQQKAADHRFYLICTFLKEPPTEMSFIVDDFNKTVTVANMLPPRTTGLDNGQIYVEFASSQSGPKDFSVTISRISGTAWLEVANGGRVVGECRKTRTPQF